MKKYYFKTKEFGVTDNGIHLLRSEFNYETISFSKINQMEVTRGKELNNWPVIFICGLIMLIPGVYISINIINVLLQGDFSAHSARLVFVLFIPLIGGYFIYTSMQTGWILKITPEQGKNRKFSLKQLITEKQLGNFKLLMKEKLDTKFRVS